jgi:hypothetical protein
MGVLPDVRGLKAADVFVRIPVIPATQSSAKLDHGHFV